MSLLHLSSVGRLSCIEAIKKKKEKEKKKKPTRNSASQDFQEALSHSSLMLLN
jgi:hypothetical protein